MAVVSMAAAMSTPVAEASRRRRDAEAQEAALLEREMAQQAPAPRWRPAQDAKRRSDVAEEQRKRKQQAAVVWAVVACGYQEMARQMADAAREAAEQKARMAAGF
eukprot:Skav200070  [mRNA]  locus=scaffold838:174694:176587:- [translate_table: standard]